MKGGGKEGEEWEEMENSRGRGEEGIGVIYCGRRMSKSGKSRRVTE